MRWIDRHLEKSKVNKRRFRQSEGMVEWRDSLNRKQRLRPGNHKLWKLHGRINLTYRHPMAYWMDLVTCMHQWRFK